MEDREVFAYFAGIVDGEGCLRIEKNSKRACFSPMITVVNTNPILIDKLHFFFGGYVGSYQYGNSRWKLSYVWRITGSNAIDLLSQLMPYLVVKKAQAEQLMAFWRIHEYYGVRGGGIEPSPWEYVMEAENIIKKVSSLNRKGAEKTGKELNYGR